MVEPTQGGRGRGGPPNGGGIGVNVRDAMTEDVLTITPGRTLRDAARFMVKHNVGALVIMDPEQPGPGIITMRDIMHVWRPGSERRSAGAPRLAAVLVLYTDGRRITALASRSTP